MGSRRSNISYETIIRKNTYGNPIIKTPFGLRKTVYADTTASSQKYKLIENYLEKKVYPYYANTHSNAFYGRQMSQFIKDARCTVANSLGANTNDKILFTGSGCTSAIMHLIHIMNLRKPNINRYVIIISSTEHNSNFLAWKHLPVDLDIIDIDKKGLLRLDMLKEKIIKWKNKKRKNILVSVSAGSNVTGVIQNINQICNLVHKLEALIAFDYAAIAPYVKINMHVNDDIGEYIDALYLSPHKFLGGAGTTGILVANKKLFINNEPIRPGGGTVRFVFRDRFIYSSDPEIRENGGTPNILGIIRCGLIFQLKNKYINYIEKRDNYLVKYIQKKLIKIKGIEIINPLDNINRIPIFSFIVYGLHYNLVVALLNDLFGIQTRGGISCCGIFAQYILHMSEHNKNKVIKSILQNKGIPKNYGWCRVSFNYYMPIYIVDYILEAIYLVATYGKNMEKKYIYEKKKNHWVYTGFKPIFQKLDLKDTKFTKEKEVWITEKECQNILKTSSLILNKSK